jgi:hypothetical protein
MSCGFWDEQKRVQQSPWRQGTIEQGRPDRQRSRGSGSQGSGGAGATMSLRPLRQLEWRLRGA